MEYEVVIGLEIHVELLTRTKMFCGCPVSFGAPPNTNVCPVCLAMPGTLPVINKQAVKHVLKVALALDCEVRGFTQFYRKNYFYPDLPKGYQISQYDFPIGRNGGLWVGLENNRRRIGIARVHLEEDTAKLLHPGETGRITEAEYSLVDFNRAGIPLMEVVTEPDIRSPEEARDFVVILRSLLRYLGVSDCNLEEGSMRCDANVSVRPIGSQELGVKTEIKNLNSFRALQRGLEHEIKRQIELIESGGTVVQETRHFDARTGTTAPLRTKEYAHDYRYFPEPDLVPVLIDEKMIEDVRAEIGELPWERLERLQREHGLMAEQALRLALEKEFADYFEKAVAVFNDPVSIYNAMCSELSGLLNEFNVDISASPIAPEALAKIVKLQSDGIISTRIAKELFSEVFRTGRDPEEIVKSKGLVQVSDESQVISWAKEVIAENERAVEDYRSGKKQALSFLVGQMMRKSKGKVNPGLANKVLCELLDSQSGSSDCSG